MSQYLYGPAYPITLPVATAKAIPTGVAVGLNANLAVTAADETWVTDEATTQTNFAARFAGMSDQEKLANQTRPYGNSEDNQIRVCTGGEYELKCEAAQYRIGNYVGPAKDVGNNLLLDTYKVVPTLARATHVVVRETAAGATKVVARVLSTLVPTSK